MNVSLTFDTTLVERLIARAAVALFECGWREHAEQEFSKLDARGIHVREGFFAARRTTLVERLILKRRLAREEVRLHRLDDTPIGVHEKPDYDKSRVQILVRMHQHLCRLTTVEQNLGSEESAVALTALVANLRNELRVVYKVSV